MVAMWSWGHLSSPDVANFAFRLYTDLEMAKLGLLDMDLVTAFANIHESATGKSHERIAALLQQNHLPDMEMEKIWCRSGLLEEDAFCSLSEAI